MRILGISAFHRDAAAAVLVDGKPVAAAQEGRFTRLSLDPAFPTRAIRSCLFQAGVQARELDRVVFYEKPLRKFERVLALHMRSFPKSSKSFAKSLFLWLGDRLWLKTRIAQELEIPSDRIMFCEHQRSLAANAFFTSPFEEATLLTVDDAGEWATTALGHGRGSDLQLSAEVLFPHSLGLLASTITQFLGFVPGEDEGLVETLATYGTPRFAEALGQLVAEQDGLFSIDQRPFRLTFDTEWLFGEELEELLGPPRHSGDPLRLSGDDRRDADVAASLQQVLEQRVLALALEAHRRAPHRALCFGGEVAANRRLNSFLRAQGPFEEIHVPGAPGKAGGALGAALWLHHCIEGGAARKGAVQVDLGEAIEDRAEPGARVLGENGAVQDELARRLADGARVAWVRGRMDFGPRSLGRRSVLADPRPENAKRDLLSALQLSESFLECRLAVPAERAAEFFELPEGCDSALRAGHLVVPAQPALREHAPGVPAPDGTVWPQLVDADRDPEFHALLCRHGETSGAPLLLHTTFELRGSPMVRNEAEAVDAWRRSGLECLVAANRLYEREQ